MNRIKNKNAIITGGAKGIGRATAIKLAYEGAQGIVIADLDLENSLETCKIINKETASKCIAVNTNVSIYEDIRKLFKIAKEQFKTLDILVNCAGICPIGNIDDIDEEQWDKVFAINLKSMYLCTREAIKIMKEKKYGKIINVSSISGRIGSIATGINYATSKGAAISMTMSLAKDTGPYNINVNAVAPGFINTDMTKNFTHFNPETVPLRRIGEAEDVANVIAFLASEESSYITGLTLDVNGGIYMG